MVVVRRVPPPRPSTTRHRLSALLLASITLVGLTAASCDDGENPIALGSAGRATVVEVVDAPASVTARAAATLTAPADGTLAALKVGAGDTVVPGQVLAVVDSPAARARLEKAEQALRAAGRAGRGIGGDGGDLARVQRATDKAAARAFAAADAAADKIGDRQVREALLAQVDAARKQYESASRAVSAAVGSVQRGVAGLSSAMSALATAQRLQAQQAYDLAKSTVDALTLRAPIGGVVQLGGPASAGGSADTLAGLLGAGSAAAPMPGVGALTGPVPAASVVGVDTAVAVGVPVTAGTPVLTVVDLSDLGLVAEVDETDILLVTPGLSATVELDAATGASYPAQVRSVDILPTGSTRGGVSYRVRLSLTAGRFTDGRPAPTPRPGMSAVVHLRVRQATDAVTVPAAAVFSAEGRDAVWVVRDGRAERVAVTAGVQGQDLIEIVDGVRSGDRIVVRGTEQVRDGQRLP